MKAKARLLSHGARLLLHLGQAEKAAAAFERASEIVATVNGKDHANYGIAIGNLSRALLVEAKGKGEGAIGPAIFLSYAAKRIVEAKLGHEHLESGRICANLGVGSFYAGIYQDSETYLKQALSVLENVQNNAQARAEELEVRFDLARVLTARGKHTEGARLIKKTVQLCEVQHGVDHLMTAKALESLSVCIMSDVNTHTWFPDRILVAESSAQKALSIYETDLGTTHPATVALHKSLGDLKVITDLGRSSDRFGVSFKIVTWPLCGCCFCCCSLLSDENVLRCMRRCGCREKKDANFLRLFQKVAEHCDNLKDLNEMTMIRD